MTHEQGNDDADGKNPLPLFFFSSFLVLSEMKGTKT
jgi:hypothetical protein